MKTTEYNDPYLVARSQRGDAQAFADLVERHRDRAFRIAYRLTRNHDDAEDIACEAFVRAYRSLGGFSGNSTFSTWLYRIVTNCFLDRKRNRNRPTFLSLDGLIGEDGGPTEMQLPSTDPSPHVEMERGAQIDCLNHAIASLPEQYRTMIVLFHGEQMSYEEISDVLDLPLGTVKSRLNRARLALRDRLSEDAVVLLAL